MKVRIFITIALILVSTACSSEPLDYEPAKFNIKGHIAVMTGVIDENIEDTLGDMFEGNPDVTTIVLKNVEGSVDDEANLSAAYLVRESGLNTHVPSEGLVASGGTDFFLAGVRRTADSMARIGVHSWADDNNVEGAQLSRDHADHDKYLEYYSDMGIPEDFYWFTLKAASSDDMHWMTLEEQRRYKITTH